MPRPRHAAAAGARDTATVYAAHRRTTWSACSEWTTRRAELTDDLPERRLDAGQQLFEQHDADHSIVAVLVDGALRVEIDGSRFPDITIPGSFVGEVGALLDIPRTATVVAARRRPCGSSATPQTFFGSHPSLALELARQLAGRLHRLTSYLEDVRTQFAGSEGHLTMVDSVLNRLAAPPVDIQGGSDRAPDY